MSKTPSPTHEELLLPMHWEDFKQCSREFQAQYLTAQYEDFHASLTAIAAMLGVSPAAMRQYLSRRGINYTKGVIMSSSEIEAWQKHISITPEEALKALRYNRVIDLRNSGGSFNGIARELGMSNSTVSMICRVYDAVRVGDYSDLLRNRLFCSVPSIFKWAAATHGKDFKTVYEEFHAARDAYRQAVSDQWDIEHASIDIPPGVHPDDPAEIEVETVSQAVPTAPPELSGLLKSLNENLTFFRNLFSGALVPTTA